MHYQFQSRPLFFIVFVLVILQFETCAFELRWRSTSQQRGMQQQSRRATIHLAASDPGSIEDADFGEFTLIPPKNMGGGPPIPMGSPITSGFIPTVNTFDPDKIDPESFQGFLKEEFSRVTGSVKVLMSFDQFYAWKSKNGIVLSVEEVHDIWEAILDKGYLADPNDAACSLELFIKINLTIDEML